MRSLVLNGPGSKMNSGELENVTVKKTLAWTDQTT